MAMDRRSFDWERDREGARGVEAKVREALQRHPLVSRIGDLSEQPETPDFEFVFEGRRVGLEVKAKHQYYGVDYGELWPEVEPERLFIVDELCLRKLFHEKGMGYLLVHDAVRYGWVVYGPWHLLFGPHRRFEGTRDKGNGPFQKGKLLIDFEVGEHIGPRLDLDLVLGVVRQARADTATVRAIAVRNQAALPVVPKPPLGAPLQTETGPAPKPARLLIEPVVAHAEPAADELVASEVWCGLDQSLADALLAHHGWAGPTPVQAAAIPPILAGATTLVLAPTAGGKTEAAVLPLLDVSRREQWEPLSIVAVSPMKALLDDQRRRYAELGTLTGATAFAWHGDTPSAERRAFLESPTDILLTTPESLEILLHNGDAKRLFNRVRAVVVDEVHAFVGTPRGAQLAGVLERLGERSIKDVQRVGLSATVGAPAQVLAWLGGSSHRQGTVATVPGAAVREETRIATYEDDNELVALLNGVVAEQRTLVFVQSRRRAEDLGASCGLPVHHSSVFAAGRRSAVEKFRAGEVPALVATSTLELGIDIGDVELVAQDGAPSGPASYLQRVGRSGRRSGLRRMLFTAGSPDDLLQILAVLARVRRGSLEAASARRGARLVLGQQALSLVLDPTSVGMARPELGSTLCHSPVFRGLDEDVEAVLDHLIGGGWLADLNGTLVAGAETIARFGGPGRAFAELAVSFDSRASIGVVTHEGSFIGFIDWSEAQADKRIGRGEPFRLAGRVWKGVDVVDGSLRVVPAAGANEARAPSWRGPSLEVDRQTWETAREVLEGTEVPSAVDDRGAQWLSALRAQWRPLVASPVAVSGDDVVVATFAGAAVHRSVLAMVGFAGTTDGPTLRIRGARSAVTAEATAVLSRFDELAESECRRLAPEVAALVKHGGLVPESVIVNEAREFAFDRNGVHNVLALLAGD
jgi:ATP-dependent Lhr-like helicase